MSKIYLPKLTPDSTSILNGVTVHRHFLKDHNVNNITLPPMRRKPLTGVTIHNTEDLPSVEDDGEQYTRATLNDNMNSIITLTTFALGRTLRTVGATGPAPTERVPEICRL